MALMMTKIAYRAARAMFTNHTFSLHEPTSLTLSSPLLETMNEEVARQFPKLYPSAKYLQIFLVTKILCRGSSLGLW
ncbi:unnamed protein product [Allacma fusca]|uniref:Uncharacterized protein n=1 Tax=Allacma fusca TaxID=39272 RepID=A0A8J2P6C2_9HEXA|nr:unnamed protein product [Allacma fusca]